MSWFNSKDKKQIEQLTSQVNELQSKLSENITCELYGQEQPIPVGSSSQSDERTKRKAKLREFMKLYENDAITFALVNFLTHRIVPSFSFVGDPNAVTKLNEWASKRYFKRVLEDMTMDMILCGGAWVEAIWSSIEIEKFKIINPDKMDFIRDQSDNTLYDAMGDPVGYIQDFNGTFRYWYKDRITSGGNDIFTAPPGTDLRQKLRYYKLKSYGDSELGISLIQPNYRSAIIRTNIEDMVGEAAFRGGGLVAYIEGELPPDVKKNLKIDMQNIKSKNIFLLSNKIQLSNVPIPELNEREALIYLFADIQCGGMGVPLEMILQGITTSQKSGSIPDKTADLEIRVMSFQERLAEQVNEYIIQPLLDNWKIKGKANIMFPPASPTNQLNRARVIATLARRNLMTYDPEVELQIRKELKLPTELLNKVYEEWKKNPPPVFAMEEQDTSQTNDNFNKGDSKDNDVKGDNKEKPKKKLVKKVNQIPEGG
jgi:hypothetical protein